MPKAIFIPLATNLKPSALNLDWRFYPNPAKDYLQIELPQGIYRLSLFNLQGQKLREQEAFGAQTWSLSELPAGTYILLLQDLEHRQLASKQLLIQ